MVGIWGRRVVLCLAVAAWACAGPHERARETAFTQQKQALAPDEGWFPIGPAPINVGQVYVNSSQNRLPATGRATVIQVNPQNPDDVYLGTAGGGLWHTSNARDGDPVWTFGLSGVGEFQSNAIGAVALQSCHSTSSSCGPGIVCGCDVIWAGTGENGRRRDTQAGAGVYRFAERGSEIKVKSFNEVAGTATRFKGGNVLRILPESSLAALVLLTEGVTSNSTHATVIAPAPTDGYGLYRVSDGAGTVTKLPIADAGTALPSDMQRATIDSTDTLFVAYTGLGIFRSTDVDSGATFCSLTAGVGTACTGATPFALPAGTTHIELAIAPTDTHLIYASLGTCFTRIGNACGNTKLIRSTDGGKTWSNVTVTTTPDGADVTLKSYAGYTDALSVHPSTSTRFFFGGDITWDCTMSDATNAHCSGFGSSQIHPDIHDISIVPGTPDTIYVASDGGFYSSLDGGTTFRSGGRDLGEVQFQSIATNPNTDVIIGGLQDNGVVNFTGSRTWIRSEDGDGGDTRIDSISDMGSTHIVTYSTIYTGFQLGRYEEGVGKVPFDQPGPSTEPVAFYAPLEQDPNTHNLYYGRQSLFRSNDTDAMRGDSWDQISPVMGDTTTMFPAIENFNNINAIGLSSDTNVIYLGYYNGEVFVSNASAMGPCNSTACWQQLSGPGLSTPSPLPAGPITSIAVDPTKSARAYFTISGFATGAHVYVYDASAGTKWQAFDQGVSAGPANVIKVAPSDANELWLGTDTGLYQRHGTDNWAHITSTFPVVPVYDISVDDAHQRVVAATHGRGAWVHTTPVVDTLEGWAMGTIWDIPTTGTGFVNTGTTAVTCNVQLIQQSGTICAQGNTDALGGTAQITAPDPSTQDPGGKLVTTNGSNMFWACNRGHCINNTDISHCNFVLDGMGMPTSTPDPVTEVRVQCPGSPDGVGHVLGAPSMNAPPENALSITVPGDFQPPTPALVRHAPIGAPKSKVRTAVAGGVAADMTTGSGSFDLAVSLQAGAGNTRELCHTTVHFDYSETSDTILERAVDQLAAEPDCTAQGIVSKFIGPLDEDGGEEDEFQEPPSISVTAPLLEGSRSLVTMRALPGAATGVCFAAKDLLSRFRGQATIMKLKPITLTTGALGGALTVSQTSGIGTCTRTLTTTAGESQLDLATAIADAFQNAGVPGPADCRARENARDFDRSGDTLFMAFTDRITLCSTDPGVGFVLGPEEIDLTFNKLPVALCQDKTLNADTACSATVGRADVDAGSFDPDGPTPTCTPSPTGPLGLGPHDITLTCTDNQGATSSCHSTVTVVDATPPALTCPVSINAACTSPSGATATFTRTATDNCSGLGTITCSRTSGGTFALGTTLVGCSVSDAAGNTSTCNFNVTVSLGDDPVCCPAGTHVILGSSNNDTLNGTSGRDCILGRGGQDTINGNGGDDVISGGAGDDIVSGGPGNDIIFGGTGQDRLSGNAGNDFIDGNDADDFCYGGDDNDTLLGGAGQDHLYGENGDDTLVGETGDDTLDGGSGNDSLDGDGLHDVCIGGPGTDVFLVCESQTQ
jgi:hypothetical protein